MSGHPRQSPLPIFDKSAAWDDYDTAARSLPDCEHNRAWWKQGSGRPQPPDCEHNRPWRAAIRDTWRTYIDTPDTPQPPLPPPNP